MIDAAYFCYWLSAHLSLMENVGYIENRGRQVAKGRAVEREWRHFPSSQWGEICMQATDGKKS